MKASSATLPTPPRPWPPARRSTSKAPFQAEPSPEGREGLQPVALAAARAPAARAQQLDLYGNRLSEDGEAAIREALEGREVHLVL